MVLCWEYVADNMQRVAAYCSVLQCDNMLLLSGSFPPSVTRWTFLLSILGGEKSIQSLDFVGGVHAINLAVCDEANHMYNPSHLLTPRDADT